MTPAAPPPLTGLLETALYAVDLGRSVAFYRQIFGFPVLQQDETFCALDVVGRGVLLLFRQGAGLDGSTVPGGRIPAHDGRGPVHAAFAIPAESLEAWAAHLTSHGVAIESRLSWPAGGVSLFFRDPDGHLLEVLTPGVWRTY